MPNQLPASSDSLAAVLTPAPTATSFGRPWDGAVVNWHDWPSGGRVVSLELDHDVIAMRTSGTVRLTQVRDGQTHTDTVGVGNVTVHPRGMSSSWVWDNPGAIMIMRMPPSLLQQAADTLIRSPLPSTALRNCFGRRDAFVERIVMQFLDELHAPVHPSQEYISQALSHALAAHLVHRFNAHGATMHKLPPGLNPRAMERVKDYIEAHLHEAIDLQTLATLANVSRFHFARMFKQGAGISAMTYLEQARMRRACHLIRAGGLTLAHIASLVGYDDPSYFTRRFRAAVGMTPTAYAREAGVAGWERMLK
jgi:AraC family transcriptional regulator